MPILDRSGHFSLLSPSRTVCIAFRLSDQAALPKNMWMSDPTTPMRSMRVSEEGDLVLAGESFDQGSGETNEKYEVLEKWAREHFPVDRITYRWSGQKTEHIRSEIKFKERSLS